MKKRIIILSFIVLIILIITICMLYRLNFIQHKMYSNNHFNIKTYISNIDKDNDIVGHYRIS